MLLGLNVHVLIDATFIFVVTPATFVLFNNAVTKERCQSRYRKSLNKACARCFFF